MSRVILLSLFPLQWVFPSLLSLYLCIAFFVFLKTFEAELLVGEDGGMCWHFGGTEDIFTYSCMKKMTRYQEIGLTVKKEHELLRESST